MSEAPDDADALVESVPSPCVRNCCLDQDNVCVGCYRTMSEICAWHEAPDEEKLKILIRCRLRYKRQYEKLERSAATRL